MIDFDISLDIDDGRLRLYYKPNTEFVTMSKAKPLYLSSSTSRVFLIEEFAFDVWAAWGNPPAFDIVGVFNVLKIKSKTLRFYKPV